VDCFNRAYARLQGHAPLLESLLRGLVLDLIQGKVTSEDDLTKKT
jgi:hypothetical protein